MIITFFGDVHNYFSQKLTDQFPGGDVLCFLGDYGGRGTITETLAFLEWFDKIPGYRHKIMIAGNHDWLFARDHGVAKSMIPVGIIYLENEGVMIDDYYFWGSPYTPAFRNWAFMTYGDEAERIWSYIPSHTEILLTHGPPLGILDEAWQDAGRNCGCEYLLKAVRQIKPRIHAFGHIHEEGGHMILGKDTLYVNAAIMDASYKPVNKPITIVLEDK
jgi:predicted phosphohydrolase